VKRLGVGMLGWARFHVSRCGLQENRYAEIRAICDSDPEVLARKKVEYGLADAHEYQDYRRVWNRTISMQVTICVPNYLHSRFAIAALKAGKHVLCEKPLCISMQQCEDLVTAVARSG